MFTAMLMTLSFWSWTPQEQISWSHHFVLPGWTAVIQRYQEVWRILPEPPAGPRCCIFSVRQLVVRKAHLHNNNVFAYKPQTLVFLDACLDKNSRKQQKWNNTKIGFRGEHFENTAVTKCKGDRFWQFWARVLQLQATCSCIEELQSTFFSFIVQGCS